MHGILLAKYEQRSSSYIEEVQKMSTLNRQGRKLLYLLQKIGELHSWSTWLKDPTN